MVDAVISFATLCDVYEKIVAKKTPGEKQAVVKEFLDGCRKKLTELSKRNQAVHKSLFPILRLLVPNFDRDRGPYHLKEQSFAKTIVNIFGISPTGPDGTLLYKYKTSRNSKVKDFADAACVVLRKRLSNDSSLTIANINCSLADIAAKAANDIRGQEDAVFKLFQSTSTVEQKWVVRLILKELKLGIGDNNILAAFHSDAPNLFLSNTNLAKICELLHDPSTHMNEIEVGLFNAFRPMLSLRCDVKQFNKSVTEKNPLLYIENKFDGERFQLHMQNGSFKYFSRGGFDFTASFGENYRTGILTSCLKNAFAESVKSIILDGEMMTWNKRTRLFGSKGLDVDVKHLKPDSVHQPCFVAFDIVFLNGKVLTRLPLSERKKILVDQVKPIDGVIIISQSSNGTCKQDVIDALNMSIDKKEEGVVYKDPNSLYVPDARKGWWKLKLEYFEGVMSDLDVMIMGGYYGNGKQKRVSDFVVGVLDKASSKYLSFARIGTGLSVDESKTLHNKLGPQWKEFAGKEYEKYNMVWGKEVPHVWIIPEKSCCLEVRGTELIKYNNTATYAAGCTLRFPRILKLRLDKSSSDCLTTDELSALNANPGYIHKLTKRHLELSDLDMPVQAKKSKKKVYVPRKIEVDKRSDLLAGYEFLVLSGKEEWSTSLVEVAIKENGGSLVLAEGSNTLCMLAGDDHHRIPTYEGGTDIVHVDWLRFVLNENEVSMYTPLDMIYTSPETKKYFMRHFDRFGDSYTEATTEKQLKSLVAKVFTDDFEKNNYMNLMPLEIKSLNSEMNFVDSGKPFRGYTVYFDKYKMISNATSKKINHSLWSELDFLHKGGTVTNNLTKDIKYIVANTSDEERVMELRIHLKAIRNGRARIVNHPELILQHSNSEVEASSSD